MNPGPSRHYSTQDVVEMVLDEYGSDTDEHPPEFEFEDPALDEPVFYGSDDEIGLVEEEVDGCESDCDDKSDNGSFEELNAFLGFMILMGLVKLPSLADYRSRDATFHYGKIADRISRDRFLEITRYLHFADNATLFPPGIYTSFFSRHHHIYYDNYFSSVDLSLDLERNGLYSCGTLTVSNMKEFRSRLADALIGSFCGRKRRGRPSLAPPPKHFAPVDHWPTRGAEKAHRCHYCHTQLSRRRETVWRCQQCEKFLCCQSSM